MIHKNFQLIMLCIVVSILVVLPSFPLTFDIYLPQTFLPKVHAPFFLKPGDILFCDLKTSTINLAKDLSYINLHTFEGFSNDHCMMYIGNNKFIESCPYYCNSDGRNCTGVVITPYEVISFWATNITYGTINTSQKIRNNAVYWAKKQLGKPYGGPDGLYCGELIWYAYFEQGFSIMYSIDSTITLSYRALYPNRLRRSDNIYLYKIKNA